MKTMIVWFYIDSNDTHPLLIHKLKRTAKQEAEDSYSHNLIWDGNIAYSEHDDECVGAIYSAKLCQ